MTEYKVKGYTGRWSVIDRFWNYSLLEHNTFGNETCYLVVENNTKDIEYTLKKTGEKIILPTFTNVICETYDDLITALNDEGLLI